MYSFRFAAALLVFWGMVTIEAAAVENGQAQQVPYAIVDTAQNRTFTASREIAYPQKGEPFHGQDAQYQGLTPTYRDNGDRTVSDLNTGLMWVKTPDFKNKQTFNEALAGAGNCRVGGYTDWRLPTIKELYSLIDFNGYAARTEDQSKPYIDTAVFDFAYGDSRRGERLIDAQYASSTLYVGSDGKSKGGKLFGVNFADGRIKGYDLKVRGRTKTFYVRYVRGNPAYGKNDFLDNGDDTVTDRATGLMWQQTDSGRPLNWEEALAYAENLTMGGYSDWRLPNAKELQSIVDYTRAPEAADPARRSAAIDPVFSLSRPESWFWTGTTHLDGRTCDNAVYIAFGRAFGTMRGNTFDVHGAGAQRSDPKTGDPAVFKNGRGPQGDEIRIRNYVRCVRGGDVKRNTSGPAIDGNFTSRPQSPFGGGRPGRGGFIQRLDKDGDGKVSRSEFDGPGAHFGQMDRDRDGYLSADEAPQGPPPGRPPRQGKRLW